MYLARENISKIFITLILVEETTFIKWTPNRYLFLMEKRKGRGEFGREGGDNFSHN